MNGQNDKHLKLIVAFHNDFAKAPKIARYTISFRILDLKKYCDQITGRGRNQHAGKLHDMCFCK